MKYLILLLISQLAFAAAPSQKKKKKLLQNWDVCTIQLHGTPKQQQKQKQYKKKHGCK